MKNIIKFEYKEYGNREKVRAYSIELNEDYYVLKIRKEEKTYTLNKESVDKIFEKYDFKNLTVDSMYPFKAKEQIDYRIKIIYGENHEVIDFNGYSHFPKFYNEFISDLAKLVPGRSVLSLKVKDEMIDKDDKYKTNYVEKISVYAPSGDLVISQDHLTEEGYEVDVYIPKLLKYYKKDDLNFVLPINVHYFTYIVNKLANFNNFGTSRKGDYEYYIDIRLHNKKHRYFDLNEKTTKSSLEKLISYIKIFSKLPIYQAFLNDAFVDEFLNSHNIPKTKEEINDEFIALLDSGKVLIDALKITARANQNYSMYELISLAYQNQDFYYVYLIDDNFNIEEIKISTDDDLIESYFEKEDFNDLDIIELSKDYDALYYKEDSKIHLVITSAKYEDLKYLKLKDSLKEDLINLLIGDR